MASRNFGNSNGDKTVVNSISMPRTSINSGSTTQVNSSLSNNDTQINPNLQQNAYSTAVNTVANNYGNTIPLGSLLLGKYKIESVLSDVTGEAVLYICSYRNAQYVAKVYRRVAAIKEDVVDALKSIKSPYVARLFETGDWNGLPFEIIPYYKNGSLEGKTYSFDELKNSIIPALNKGLKVLHDKNIIHKDLKPSNIMLTDNLKDVAIIDFGISSVREDGKTVLVTKTGMTPDYSAPETFHNLFLQESDYYSLGITIYELFCGHTPYSGVSQEVLEKYTSVQKLPFPKTFPEKLKNLILGLTYIDISNRRDKNNPNRRWTYSEVEKWCAGKEQAIPGVGIEMGYTENSTENTMPPITFMYKKYTNLSKFINAIGLDWNNGKKRLYRSALADHFKKFNSDLANFCTDAEDVVKLDKTQADIEFFKCLYRVYPELQAFYWQDYHFGDMVELGSALLDGMRDKEPDVIRMADSFIKNHLFSKREGIINRNKPEISRRLAAIEEKYIYAINNTEYTEAYAQIFLIAYYYTKSHTLCTTFGNFETVDELTKFIKYILDNQPESLDYYSRELIAVGSFYDGLSLLTNTTPEFRAWLIVNGKGNLFN